MSKAWPEWWGLSSSPVELAHGERWRQSTFALGGGCFVLMSAVLAWVAFAWPRWRGTMLLALLGLGALPWVGVAIGRWRRQCDEVTYKWLCAVGMCLFPYFLGVPFLLIDSQGRGGRQLGIGLLFAMVMGFFCLAGALFVTHLSGYRRRRTTVAQRVLEALLVATLGLLAVSTVRTWRGNVRDVFPITRRQGDGRASITLHEAHGRCWVETSHGASLGRRCDGPTPRLRYAGWRTRRHDRGPLLAIFLHREANVVDLGTRLVSIDGVEASAFLGEFPRTEYVVATWMVWLLAAATWVDVRRRMKAWRALSMVEATVREDGLLTADGRRVVTGVALPLGAKVMVEDPKRLGASYRDDAVRSERVVVADEAQWAEALTAAERHVWMAHALSLVIVGGILAIDLFLVW